MTRVAQQQSSRRASLTAAVALLLVLSVLPPSWGAWLSPLGDVARVLIAPIQQPVYRLARWLVPARGARPEDAELTALRQERDRFQALWLREQQRAADLERRMVELQRGVALTEIPVRQVPSTVIGHGSEGVGGELVVRAGSGQGVEVNNVVTAAGVQIVGRVTRVGIRQSQVRLLTDFATGQVQGRLMRGEQDRGPLVLLKPLRAGGVLQGQVEYRSGEPAVEPGALVRLEDDTWPRSAAMLVVGVVEDVSTTVGGRAIVRVRPAVDLDRLSEVVVRTNPEEAAPPPTTDPATKGGAR